MPEKILVFANDEKTGVFWKYYLIEESKPDVEKLVEDFNNNPENNTTCRIIEDVDVLAAIIQKESAGSIKSYCKDVETSVEEISEQIGCLESELSSFMHKIKEDLKDKDE